MEANQARSMRFLANAAVLMTAFVAMALLAGSASAVAGTDAAVYTPDISFSSGSPVDGSQISILVNARNLGDQNATDVLVSAYRTSTQELIGTSTISFIGPHSQVETAILWNISGEGPMTVTVTVSPSEADVQPDNNNAVSPEITVRARPDLKVDSVTFDNAVPTALTPAARIYVTISNIGGSDASLAHVTLYDGPPANMMEIYNTTILSGVPLSSPQTITYDWSLAGHGGRHDIYAVIDSSTPAEKADSSANNWASGRILVLTTQDLEVSTAQIVNYDPLYDGFVIVHSGGVLTFVNSTFAILQERANEFDIIVEAGGTLIMSHSHIESAYAVGLTIRSGGTVLMAAGSTFGGSISSEGGGLWLFNTSVTGDVDGKFRPLWVEDSSIAGAVAVTGTNATIARTSITTGTNLMFGSSTLDAEWVTAVTGIDPAIALWDTTTARLAGLDAGTVWCEPGSTASVERLAEFRVADLTGMPIPGAAVQSRHSLNGTVASTVTTDIEGMAWAWLESDMLSESSPQYVGSYIHAAAYLTYHTQSVANMANYPTLTGESNRQLVELTFDVINPADIFHATIGDRTFSTSTELFDFNQTGNLFVRGALTVNGTLMVWQTRDFETALVIHSGQVSIGPQGAIRSNHALNIYLYNASELTSTGGTLAANAVVTFNTARVSLAGGVSVPQGSFILGGSSFSFGGDSSVSGTRLYARAGTSVIFDGATASFAVIDVETTGDIQVTNATLTTFTDLTLRSANKTLKTAGSQLICAAGGDAAFEANFIDMAGTSVTGCNIVLFSAATIQGRDTVFSSTLTGFRAGSSATFYDVYYPALDAVKSAIITAYHKLTMHVIDINQNAVTVGSYQIVSVPSGATVDSHDLSAAVEVDLVAWRVEQGFADFTGNYRVTVTPPADTGAAPITRDLVMDNGRDEVFSFPQEIVMPSGVEVEADATPAQIFHGGEVTIAGEVGLFYPNRLLPTYRAGITVTVDDGAGFTQTTTTDAQGMFNWTGDFTPTDPTPSIRQVNVSATYGGATAKHALTIEILKPAPAGLVIKVDADSVHFEPAIGQSFIVRGQVYYTDVNGEATDPANNTLVQITFTLPFQPDLPPSGRTTENGHFAITVLGRNAPKSYNMKVVATDDKFGFNAPGVDITAIVGAGGGQAPVGSSLVLPILLAAGLGVAGLIGFLVVNAKRKSVNYVECGNCGRPAHEGDKKCPSCGCEFEEDIAKCSHCASWIPANAVRCPKCNTEFKPVGDAVEAPTVAPDKVAPEGVKAEVTTVAEPVKAPVAVKKKVLKTAEPAGQPQQKATDGPQFENPWDKPGEASTPPGGQPTSDQAKPAEKKPEEKKEKGLFDDL